MFFSFIALFPGEYALLFLHIQFYTLFDTQPQEHFFLGVFLMLYGIIVNRVQKEGRKGLWL
jgi:hypothetical protein